MTRQEKFAKQFVEKATLLHCNKYDYGKVVYTRARDKVTITCPVHGDFVKTPNKHLSGQGCAKCSNEQFSKDMMKPFDKFVGQANKLHNSKYTYDESTYRGAKVKLTITCPAHGEFTQDPDHHLNRGSGCPECARLKLLAKSYKSTAQFVNDAVSVHGDTYTYSDVWYKNAHTPVTITCKVHGDFEQTPSNHLVGKGCKRCSSGGGYDGTKAGTLYYLSIDDGKYYKVGVTNRTVWQRFSKDEHHRIEVIKEWEYPIGYDAAKAERTIVQTHKTSVTTDRVLRNGNTEVFDYDVLGLHEKGDISDL